MLLKRYNFLMLSKRSKFLILLKRKNFLAGMSSRNPKGQWLGSFGNQSSKTVPHDIGFKLTRRGK